jgi:hypothetical protein
MNGLYVTQHPGCVVDQRCRVRQDAARPIRSTVTPMVVCPHLKALRAQALSKTFIAACVFAQAVNHMDTPTHTLVRGGPPIGDQTCTVFGGEIAQRGRQGQVHGMRATTSATDAVKRRA